ncbi:MAG: hypothetical protein OHK0023_13740 [Anaerolineae bacterium]
MHRIVRIALIAPMVFTGLMLLVMGVARAGGGDLSACVAGFDPYRDDNNDLRYTAHILDLHSGVWVSQHKLSARYGHSKLAVQDPPETALSLLDSIELPGVYGWQLSPNHNAVVYNLRRDGLVYVSLLSQTAEVMDRLVIAVSIIEPPVRWSENGAYFALVRPRNSFPNPLPIVLELYASDGKRLLQRNVADWSNVLPPPLWWDCQPLEVE